MYEGPDCVIGLDLGTRTGFSIMSPTSRQWFAGTLTLATRVELAGRDRSSDDIRFSRLRSETFRRLMTESGRIAIAWEDVQFCSSTYQFQLWTVLRSAVWAAITQFEEATGRSVLRFPVAVGTLKKFATGSGAADKTRMLTAAVHRGIVPAGTDFDDNAIDAIWVSIWCAKQLR